MIDRIGFGLGLPKALSATYFCLFVCLFVYLYLSTYLLIDFLRQGFSVLAVLELAL